MNDTSATSRCVMSPGAIRRATTGAVTLGVLTTFCSGASAQAWKPAPVSLKTRWAADVRPDAPHPEYPRPTLVRDRWLNLNGLWDYAITPADAPKQDAPTGRILVPFPVESSLSGVGVRLDPNQAIWYSRTFQVPAGWKGTNTRLNFGAVDWHTQVFVNGTQVAEHRGGYDPFSADISGALREGDNTLVVRVTDPTNVGGQPRGKQWNKSHGIWYTPTSGIWQTVWIEPVPEAALARVRATPDIANGAVGLGVDMLTTEPGLRYDVEVSLNGKTVGRASSPDLSDVRVALSDVKVWTPDTPTLYDVSVRLTKDGREVDRAQSYFGLRTITRANDARGVQRLMLNGAPVFHFGPLDQGFWPDGLYTPPTDEALKFDVEAVKRMGGNMLRKHVKVESERFYYWCDRLGVMVWQDMPSPFFEAPKFDEDFPPISDEWRANFERELRAMLAARSTHPSIFMWVPFNEGWGQNDLAWSKAMVDLTKSLDPSRLVNNASGWTDMGNGDVLDIHVYPGPATAPVETERAVVLGEFGGLGLPLEGHTWIDKNNWGYRSYTNKQDLTNAYVDLLEQIPMLIGQGLCAAVYTQTTDVEIEVNGWLTYDREVWKIDPDRAAAAAKALYLPPPTVRTLMSCAGDGAAGVWRFTTKDPGDGWQNATFNDANWTDGTAGFGTKGTPGANVTTEWSSPEIWLRRNVTLPAEALAAPAFRIHHDEDAEVFINGQSAAKFSGYTTGYRVVPLSAQAAALLRPGENTIAVRCRQTGGGQYIDLGLIEIVRGTK